MAELTAITLVCAGGLMILLFLMGLCTNISYFKSLSLPFWIDSKGKVTLIIVGLLLLLIGLAVNGNIILEIRDVKISVVNKTSEQVKGVVILNINDELEQSEKWVVECNGIKQEEWESYSLEKKYHFALIYFKSAEYLNHSPEYRSLN